MRSAAPTVNAAKRVFATRANYYLVTQVRRPSRVTPRQAAALRALRLGRIGSKALVVRQPELLRAAMHVLSLVEVEPVHRRAECPGVTIVDLPARRVPRRRRAAEPLRSVYSQWGLDPSEVMTVAPSKGLFSAVKTVGHNLRPDLPDAEIDRKARSIAADAEDLLETGSRDRLDQTTNELRARLDDKPED